MTANDAAFLQLYFDRRRTQPTLRAVPETAREPTPGQIDVRTRFGKAAQATKGIRDIDERHRIIADGMRGFRSPQSKPRRRLELPPSVWAALLQHARR